MSEVLCTFSGSVRPAPFVRATPAMIRKAMREQQLSFQTNTITRWLTFKEEVATMAQQAMIGREIASGPVMVDMLVAVGRAVAEERKWDVANVYKVVEDAMTKIAYTDDVQVVRGSFEVIVEPSFEDNWAHLGVTVYHA